MKRLIDKIIRRYPLQYRRLTHPRKYKSLAFFTKYLKNVDFQLNELALTQKHKIINEVCTPDSLHFPKGCACLVSSEEMADEAIKKGAFVLISDIPIKKYPCIISEQPMAVYAKMCRYYRDLQSKVIVTAVSGSIGKTTTTAMIGTVYEQKYKTYYTQANANTLITVGFAVQHIPDNAEKMVQEVHEGTPNRTQYLSEMLHPSVFVITTIDKSHIEHFGTQDKIVEEVCSITKHMTGNGLVIVNKDEFNRFDLLNGKRIVTISTQENNADYVASNIHTNENGLSFTVRVNSTGKLYDARLNNMFASHNVICALSAFAAGYEEGVEPELIVKGLATYQTRGVRQNIFQTDNGVLVYADCYNAVGRSMKSAIEACDLIPVKGKRVAVLGDIAELGEQSKQIHNDVIQFVNDSKFDFLLTLGDNLKKAATTINTRDSLNIFTFDSINDIADKINLITHEGDLILFKGSNSCNLDKCIVKCYPYLANYVYVDTYKKWRERNLRY